MPSESRREAVPAAARDARSVSLRTLVMVAAAAFALALALYAPALGGGFVSDDLNYVTQNPTIAPLDGGRLLDIWNPRGSAARYIANYSPVQMTIVAVQYALLGDEALGYHLLNVLMHAVASVLLGAWALRLGVPPPAAAAVGALFLLHPANVEAVAWVSQLKTNGALVGALTALLCFRRHPAAGALAFALGLGFKATAAAALPAAFALAWLRRGPAEPGRGPERSAWVGLAVWTLVFAAYAGIQLGSFGAANATVAPLHTDPWLRVVNLIGLVGRYAVMATTTWGLSTFQQPDALESLLNPWVALGAATLAAIGWRGVVAWRRRSPEAAAWLFAVAGWLPSSQILPFTYPIADRYLYFVLAGAIPALALVLGRHWHRAWDRAPAGRRDRLRAAALAGCALALLGLGLRTHQRARVWRAPAFVMADAVRHYPDGLTARLARARAAAAGGDAARAEAELRGAMARGFDGLPQLLADPGFAPVRRDPRIAAVVRDLALQWVAHFEAERAPTQQSLRSLAHAYTVLERKDDAIATLERALAIGGSLDREIRARLERLRGASAKTGEDEAVRR